MTSDNDFSSSSALSTEKHKKRKTNKKSSKKSKKHKKKEKHHKSKKHSKQQPKKSISMEVREEIANRAPLEEQDDIKTIEDAFGPALPQHLQKNIQQQQNLDEKPEKTLIGPIIPSEVLIKQIEEVKSNNSNNEHNTSEEEEEEEEEDIGMYGPQPIMMSNAKNINSSNAAQIELEERALELKLAVIQGQPINKTTDDKIREEWMLELPEVGLKTGLAALGNMKRTFYQGKERPDFSDRDSWTKTPNAEGQNIEKASTSAKSAAVNLKRSAEMFYDKQRDEEQERLAKKHKKKHKREESLVEIHQKKLRKEQKKKKKELAESGAKLERRPFSRDVDLKLNKIDKNQTKQIVDKAKILNSKFAAGRTKYL